MFRIRRIHDTVSPMDQRALEQVQAILKSHFPSVKDEKIAEIPEQLRNPLMYRFRTTLFVAENISGLVRGFALMMYAPDLNFCFLDYIATKKDSISGGVGGSLYERVREEAKSLRAVGVFMECLPDDPGLCRDKSVIPQNAARLRFYERFGAFPLINTKYETLVEEDDDCPPYLVCDLLEPGRSLGREKARKIIRAILERKYSDYCPAGYVNMVVDSVSDDPVRFREPLYLKTAAPESVTPKNHLIPLVVNDKHIIHHVHDRGYVESPVRIDSILKELEKTSFFRRMPPAAYPDKYVREVHDPRLIQYIKRACESLPPGKSIYPYVFPIRNAAKPPEDDTVLAGYFCIDTFTPLNKNAYLAARRAVDCVLTGAEMILGRYRFAYALVRPPGHHAESRVFGGFCYFNSNAIAASYLSRYGRVCILDIDYHHGNGQQEIFYRRSDVLTISIHGHPSFAYPYFSGFRDETGEGEGKGYNMNLPLKEHITPDEYRAALNRAIRRIREYRPDYLIIALGLDTAKGDPTGTWSNRARDFQENGALIGRLKIPTLVVQEGGYKNRVLGINARNFFTGFRSAFFSENQKNEDRNKL